MDATYPSGHPSIELTPPEFAVTFTKPDGTLTTDITELSPNLQLLLRADTMFKEIDDGIILNRTYPAIVPRAVELGRVIGGPEELNYGHRWNENRFKRDEEASTVARELLTRVGRPDATAVEMKALGVNFSCGRCIQTLTESWEDLVVHFAFELSRCQLAQEIIRDKPEHEFIFRNTHSLEPGNPKLFARLLTSQEYIVSGSEDRTIRVWDSQSGDIVLGPLEGHTHIINSIMFSPDGSLTISGCYDGLVCTWGARQRNFAHSSISAPSDPITCAKFPPDGPRFVTGSTEGTMHIWDAYTGEMALGPVQVHSSRIYVVDFKRDHVVSGSEGGKICGCDARSGEVVLGPLQVCPKAILAIAYSSDGQLIALGSFAGVDLWNAQDGTRILGPLIDLLGYVSSVQFSPDNTRIIAGSDGPISNVVVWDVSDGRNVFGTLNGHRLSVNSVSYSPNGALIASGSDDCTIILWDAYTGKKALGPLTVHSRPILSVSFSPDSTRIVSGLADGAIQVWDVQTGEMVFEFSHGHEIYIKSVEYSPDGDRIMSCLGDRSVRIHDARSPEERAQSRPESEVGDWTINKDGWVVDDQSRLFVWVPGDLRKALMGTRAMTASQAAESSKITGSKLSERPPKRRRMQDTKTTQVPKRAKKATLSRLLDMPPEVFNEIAIHLLPADLLSLARSNKFFRKIFISRTSQHIWKQALANLPDIPTCPPELDEPQAAELEFFAEWTHISTFGCVIRAVTNRISLQDYLIPFLPSSTVIKEPEFGYVYTLKDELLKLAAKAEENPDGAGREWIERRVAQIEKRQALGGELEKYLDTLECEREKEIEELKAKRCNDIKDRLFEEGWTKQSMKPSHNNSTEWNRLVMQPKPITDRIWNNLYPKLVPLLESNRAHNQHTDRIKKIEALVENIINTSPPLVHATRETSSKNEETAPSTSSASSSARNSGAKVGFPFPSTKELLMWPMIKSIVDDDISVEEAETRFDGIRDEFDRAVVGWREAIERELLAIWNADREDEAEPEASTSKGKGRAVTRATGTQVQGTKAGAVDTTNPSGPPSIELTPPEFVVTYTKSDGVPTTNIMDLSPNLQLLLRADTMFKAVDDGIILNRTYPAIVPRAVKLGKLTGRPEEINYDNLWNESRFKRDEEASAVARELLARIGRPDATAAEMKALGANFLCGRCTQTLTDSWEDLVIHFTFESSRCKLAQDIIRDEPQRGFVFHNMHGLEPGNPKPFARLLTSQESAELSFQSSTQPSQMMVCLKCKEMDISTHCFHTFAPGSQSPIIEHLHDVHDVTVAIPGLHFREWDHVMPVFDVSEPEEYNSEEE